MPTLGTNPNKTPAKIVFKVAKGNECSYNYHIIKKKHVVKIIIFIN